MKQERNSKENEYVKEDSSSCGSRVIRKFYTIYYLFNNENLSVLFFIIFLFSSYIINPFVPFISIINVKFVPIKPD